MTKKVAFFLLVMAISFRAAAAFLLDSCETGTSTNTAGGSWSTYNDGFSTITITPDSTPAYAGSYCRSLSWTINSGGTNIYAGAATSLNSGWTGVDMSSYAGVRFYAKGTGGYTVSVATDATRASSDHYVASLNPAASWQLYEIPFSSLAPGWLPGQAWDPSSVYSIGFTAVANPGTSGQLQVDNIEFYTAAEASALLDPNIIIKQPKVNQLGYLPAEKKFFSVVTNTASSGDTYRIFDAAGNTIMTGMISAAAVNDTASTGEGVWKVDFSGLTAPGQYHVSVNSKESYPFKVAGNVYDQLFKDSLRHFYLIRCGLAINDADTGLNRNACHTAQDTIRGAAGTWDASGGWHNAGDFGKWTHMEAISAAYMMWLYELRTANMGGLNINIKESGNGVSDILNEAKWGLDWLLKMQKPDGSVYHKSDTEPNFCWGTKPDLDPFTRYTSFQKSGQAQTPSSVDAAVFTAVMAQAARVYAGVMPSYSATCANAAALSWNWLKNNRGTGQSDPYYTDAVSWQEEEWAMAEMYRLTADASIMTMFDNDTQAHAFTPMGWPSPEMFGYFSLWQEATTPAAVKNRISSGFTAWCDTMVSKAGSSGYGAARASTEYYWGSNEDIMHGACGLLMAYTMTGMQSYKDTALAQLNYILGNNSLNVSFVTKEGTNYSQHPYNWIWYDYGMLIPGWASGGANSSTYGADTPLADLINKGTPPAKCWLDLAAANGSYASNEGQTTENAALVFLSGYFYSVNAPSPTQTFTPTPHITATPTRTPTPDFTPTPVQTPGGKIGFYPSPCDLKKGDNGITFFNLPAKTHIEIYTMSGELVYKAEKSTPDGTLFWKLTPEKKSKQAAQGVYVYVIYDGEIEAARGKVAIIR